MQKRCLWMGMVLVGLLLLSGCATETALQMSDEQTPGSTAAPSPAPTPAPVSVLGQEVSWDCESLIVAQPIASLSETEALKTALESLPRLQTVSAVRNYSRALAEGGITLVEFDAAWEALTAAFPDVVFSETLLYENISAAEVTSYLASDAERSEAALLAVLSRFPNLETLSLGEAGDARQLIATLGEAYPAIRIEWVDPVFGASDTTETERTFSGETDYDALASYLACFLRLAEADLRETDLSEADGARLAAAFPETAFRRTVTLNGAQYDSFSETLSLNGAQIADAAAFSDALAAFPKLTRIELNGCNLTNEQLGAMQSRYPETKVVWTVRFRRWSVQTDAVAFSTLQYAPNDSRLTSDEVQVLQYCTDLIALDLGHNNISDLEWLRPLKNLQVLILADNKRISDISPLGALTKLKYIELFMTSVSDLTPLSQLPELLDVNLCFTGVTDPSPLLACTKLERIWFGCDVADQIGEEGIRQLTDAFPNAAFDLVSRSSTYLGWREHPRYDAFIQMFRTNTPVEPFLP